VRRRLAESLAAFRDVYRNHGVHFIHDGVPTPTDVEMVFSNEGPVFIELVQSQDNDGVYSRSQPEGVHHVAMFVPSTADRLAELKQQGVPVQYEITAPEPGAVPYAAYLDASATHGCRIELLDQVSRMFGYDEHAIVEAAFRASTSPS